MPTMPTKKNWGRAVENENRLLVRQLDEFYTDTVSFINTKISKYVTSGVDPVPLSQLNSRFEIGDIYVRTDTNRAWIMTSRTSSDDVVWTLIT